jgi:hypothetical protein
MRGWSACVILHLRGEVFELEPFLVVGLNSRRSSAFLQPPSTPPSNPGASVDTLRSMKLAGKATY